MANTFSFKHVSADLIERIKNDFIKDGVENWNPTIECFFKTKDDTTITIYKSSTVLFQGKNCDKVVSKYFAVNKYEIQNEVALDDIKRETESLIGNDEVGVGDFFGPLVIASCFVYRNFKRDHPKLASQITDSKKISDDKIYELYEEIQDKVIFSVFMIDNTLYNNLYDKYKNSHKLKALAHNQSLINIFEINPDFKNIKIVIDEFVNPTKYFSYLEDRDVVIKDNVNFETKAESKYLAVACASIIARYHFLEKIKLLSHIAEMKLPLGASNDVKKIVQKLKKEKPEIINKICKLHFNDQIKK